MLPTNYTVKADGALERYISNVKGAPSLNIIPEMMMSGDIPGVQLIEKSEAAINSYDFLQGDPWNEYANKQISLSEAWKEFFITFKMPDDDVSSRADIIMGAEKVDVWLDHIRLYEGEFVSDIEGAEPQAVEPADKLATTWAALKAL